MKLTFLLGFVRATRLSNVYSEEFFVNRSFIIVAEAGRSASSGVGVDQYTTGSSVVITY